MIRFRGRRPTVPTGERVLASARLTAADAPGGARDDALVAGTREALYAVGLRLPWEQVDTATWDEESGMLTVVETGGTGGRRHTWALEDADRLLQLVRERVTASVLLVRQFPGGRVVARRSAAGERGVTWEVRVDDGVDPDDAGVRRAAAAALADARADVGLT